MMDKDCEREIIANVERLIAGEEIKPDAFGAGLDEEARRDIEFARRLVSPGQSPTPEFQARLRTKLIHDLVEQEEARSRRSAFWSFLRRPVWLTAASSLLVFLIIGGVLLATNFLRPSRQLEQAATETDHYAAAPSAGKGTSPPAATTSAAQAPAAKAPSTTARPTTAAPSVAATPPPTPASAPAAATLLSAAAMTDKPAYKQGEQIIFTVTVTNSSASPVTLDRFPPILSIMQASSGQAVYSSPAGQTQVTLAPGQPMQFQQTWVQARADGSPAIAGSYYMELEDLQLQGRPVRLTFTQPVRFDILPGDTTGPGSVLRTIAVSQNQTSGNVTMTLRRIEITSTGFRVLAAAGGIPGYNPADPQSKYQTAGVYYMDGGWGNDAGLCSAALRADGIDLTWQVNTALPEGAARLTFSFRLASSDWFFDVPMK